MYTLKEEIKNENKLLNDIYNADEQESTKAIILSFEEYKRNKK